MRIVSLYDGISCGRVALERAGFAVSRYEAFEIDKYPRSISRYQYPDITHHGDVLDADFNLFKGYDLILGGSPCTWWSGGNTVSREVDKDGMGWKLFMRFVDAVREVQPKHFIYENVASMSANIKAYISEELGCEPILINSALVSAQQRKRLYWSNVPNIGQPEDKGILLKDILEPEQIALRDKSHTLCAQFYKANSNSLIKRKSHGLIAAKKVGTPVRVGTIGKGGQGSRIYSVHGKTVTLTAQGGGPGGSVGLYKIDLPDGDYHIRKLSTIEAERAQNLPDNYTALGIDDSGKEVKISNSQRYRSVGNGWSIDVIAHILKNLEEISNEFCIQPKVRHDRTEHKSNRPIKLDRDRKVIPQSIPVRQAPPQQSKNRRDRSFPRRYNRPPDCQHATAARRSAAQSVRSESQHRGDRETARKIAAIRPRRAAKWSSALRLCNQGDGQLL